ncbi:MAG: DUF2161 family putative PD-(D/E)XK-type phosphodiesterase [Paracoccaceae bacterium]
MSRGREADLYPPVKAWLGARGFDAKGEVGACDVLARHADGRVVAVELKVGFSLSLFQQAVARLSVTPLVYVAVPRPGLRSLRPNLALARAAGLGVLTVQGGVVACHAEPQPPAPRRVTAKGRRTLAAWERLAGDPNAGGSTGHGIVTPYRQDALACARFIAEAGPSRGAQIKAATRAAGATALMRDNHYGWFVRIERGVYGLTEAGRRGLADWGDVEV